MSSRVACWIRGHDWGPWARAENIFGVVVRVRRCRQCPARKIA